MSEDPTLVSIRRLCPEWTDAPQEHAAEIMHKCLTHAVPGFGMEPYIYLYLLGVVDMPQEVSLRWTGTAEPYVIRHCQLGTVEMKDLVTQRTVPMLSHVGLDELFFSHCEGSGVWLSFIQGGHLRVESTVIESMTTNHSSYEKVSIHKSTVHQGRFSGTAIGDLEVVESKLFYCGFNMSDISRSRCRASTFENVTFVNCDLGDALFEGCTFTKCRFIRSRATLCSPIHKVFVDCKFIDCQAEDCLEDHWLWDPVSSINWKARGPRTTG